MSKGKYKMMSNLHPNSGSVSLFGFVVPPSPYWDMMLGVSECIEVIRGG
jgi:hypothetical protein